MTTRVPDLEALRLLVQIAATGSIGGAARALAITQQSASERLRSTEALVGVPLVHRAARGSQLTPAGQVLVEWAARLLDVADEIDHAIEGLREHRDREVAVWASLTVAETLLPRWLVRLRRRQTDEGRTPTRVGLVAANSAAVLDAVREQVADLGFIEGVEAPRDLRWSAVARDELVLVTAPGTPLARRRKPLAPSEVAGLDLTVRESGSGTREVVEHGLAAHGLALAGSLVELTTGSAIRSTVLAGGAPAFLSRAVVDADVATGSLRIVPLADLPLARVLRAVWSGTAQPPAGPVRELVAIARGGESIR